MTAPFESLNSTNYIILFLFTEFVFVFSFVFIFVVPGAPVLRRDGGSDDPRRSNTQVPPPGFGF